MTLEKGFLQHGASATVRMKLLSNALLSVVEKSTANVCDQQQVVLDNKKITLNQWRSQGLKKGYC